MTSLLSPWKEYGGIFRFTEAGDPLNTRPARSNFEPWQGQKKPPGQFGMTVASFGVKRVLGRQPRCVQVPISTNTSGLIARSAFLAYAGWSESWDSGSFSSLL